MCFLVNSKPFRLAIKTNHHTPLVLCPQEEDDRDTANPLISLSYGFPSPPPHTHTPLASCWDLAQCRLGLFISWFISRFEGKLMNQHRGEERPLFPGPPKGLWGSHPQLRAKMEPGDYLRVSIIPVPLILSCRELKNWLCQDEVDTHHRSYTAVYLLIRSVWLCPTDLPLLAMLLMCI